MLTKKSVVRKGGCSGQSTRGSSLPACASREEARNYITSGGSLRRNQGEGLIPLKKSIKNLTSNAPERGDGHCVASDLWDLTNGCRNWEGGRRKEKTDVLGYPDLEIATQEVLTKLLFGRHLEERTGG